MNRTEAEDLAMRIVQSWPTMRIPVHEWADELLDLEAGAVGTALVRLRRECEFPPTIATFRGHAKAINPDRPTSKPKCLNCDGTGWVEVHSFTVGELTYAQWARCPVCLPYNQAQQGEPA